MSHSKIGAMALLAMLFALPLVAQDPPAPRDPRSELKERMKARYPLLEQLRDVGKLGETPEGDVKLVKATPAAEKVDPKDPGKGTVGELAVAENQDRQALYAFLAKEMKLTAAEVAKQNGLRNLEKAKPEHWIEVKGQWVQRKSIRAVEPPRK